MPSQMETQTLLWTSQVPSSLFWRIYLISVTLFQKQVRYLPLQCVWFPIMGAPGWDQKISRWASKDPLAFCCFCCFGVSPAGFPSRVLHIPKHAEACLLSLSHAVWLAGAQRAPGFRSLLGARWQLTSSRPCLLPGFLSFHLIPQACNTMFWILLTACVNYSSSL